MNDPIEFFVRCVGLALGLFMLWMLCALVVAMRADRVCLEKGFPKSSITWNFDAYCINLEGAVTTRIEKL